MTYARPGVRSARVTVHLSAAARARLQTGAGAVRATFTFRATTFGGSAPLVGHATAALLLSRPPAGSCRPTRPVRHQQRPHRAEGPTATSGQVAPALRGAKTVRCEGHTDSRGGRAANARLGLRRARAVCAELRRQGVHATLARGLARRDAAPRVEPHRRRPGLAQPPRRAARPALARAPARRTSRSTGRG